MQTEFSPAQLSDLATARSNEILRSCVHCGFCTATCPTYKVLGDELDSPRGRIYLIKEMLETGKTPDPVTIRHIDRCLGCLSCTSTCPSGVDYAHLIDHARAEIEASGQRPWFERLLRGALARILPYPNRFRLALIAGKAARPFRRLVPDARLRAMLDMASAKIHGPASFEEPQVFPAQGARKLRVALLLGCAQRALDHEISAATIRLLTRQGCEVVIPQGLGCCGGSSHHMGRKSEAVALAEKTVRALMAEVNGAGLDALVLNTSGCGTTLKDYAVILENSPLAAEAVRVAGLTKDITEVLEGLELRFDGSAPPLRIAYHAACSLQHGQQIRAAPKALLAAAGFEVVEPRDSHLCCGSAGTYNLLQPKIAGELKALKVESLEAKAPDAIAGGNLGCLVQIGSGTALPVVHTVSLLDWASGGPCPAALSERAA